MSKYIEQQINAQAYQRCKKITIYNPYNETPTVQFEEEQIFKRPDGSALKENLSTITKIVSNYGETFPVYNPVTQAKTGQMGSVAQLYALIWSVYMNEAVQRDAHLAKVAVEEAGRVAAQQAQVVYSQALGAANQAFADQDATDLATANALAETKATQEEKDAVMAEYATARAVKAEAYATQVDTLTNTYNAESAAAATQLIINAQAAYDAVINS